MSDAGIVFTVIVGALGLFIWNKVPAVAISIGVSLVLFASGILTGQQVVAGLGDPTVILIAALFVVAAGLEASGVTAWAGQVLVKRAEGSVNRAFLLLMLLAALACATISVNATVAALLPVAIVVAYQLRLPTSQVLLPLCFAAHSATMLTLLGAPLNVISSNIADDAGYGGIGFFEFAVAGVPILIGSMAIMFFTRRFLLPERNGESLPADFSAHAQTLVEQYRIDDGLHRLRVRSTSPYVGQARAALDLLEYPGLSLVVVQDGQTGQPLTRSAIAVDDLILVRGPRDELARLATTQHLGLVENDEAGSAAATLFNRGSGLGEVVIPPRSKLIGEKAFAGMSARSGDLVVLAIQRAGQDLGPGPQVLRAGDHLLLQGTWQALDKHLADPQVLVVDSPELVRRQAIALGHKAWEAIAVLMVLIILLVGNWFPGAVAAVICAVALLLLGVLTPQQAYKGIDWNTCILVGGMIPLAAAMRDTGAAVMIADWLINLVGAMGPRAVAVGLFMVTFVLTSVMSNTAAALVMLPIAVATGIEMEASAMPFIIAVTVGAHGALLTPIATPVNLMVLGPGGYKFGDYWKFGLPIGLWWMVVVAFIVPLYWRF